MLRSAGRTLPIQSIFAVGIGCAVTLAVYGYQFGGSNHSVYLVDALRQNDPSLLANDWFTTSTLQYHFIFTRLSALLMRMELIAPVFAIFYGLLVVLFHIAWRGIVRTLGGDDTAYLISVPLYYLCAAGTGLGMYQFFQDSALLPSNIANVALLWGIWMWIAARPIVAGVCFGIAGVFHLNHAVMVSGMALLLPVYERNRVPRRELLIGALLAIVPSAMNIGLAASQKLQRSGAMPIDQFVDLYVRLRHPHHYDPLTWPLGIWLATFLPATAGYVLLRGRVRKVFAVMLFVNGAAMICAGAWYFSETLVQLSLYRFSIYVQLLGCIAGGIWLASRAARKRLAGSAACITCLAMIAICVVRGPFFGVFRMTGDDKDYRNVCHWVSQNTPTDAILLVPPDEESMRLIGRRAIVVNFKGVPQLSADLAQWRQRLCDVLAVNDLDSFPRGFQPTLRALRARYDELSAVELQSAAVKYGARYIIATRLVEGPELKLSYTDPSLRYFIYALGA